MIKFKSFIKEDEDELDYEFLKGAEKCSSFNIRSKDFESLDNKKEIQHLFTKTWFQKFDLDKTVKGVNISILNKLIVGLKKVNRAGFNTLHKYPLKGIGPGEATLYYLIDDAHLGGGSSAGIDLIVGSKEYEIKSVSVSKDGFASNFKLGGTFSISSIMSQLQDWKQEITGKKASEVNGADINAIKKKYPKEYKALEKKYRDLTYKNYFSKHAIIFIYNLGPKIGEIASVKKVKKSDIHLERVTSGTIKPRIKL